jgi:predicted transcriptional regulator
MKERLPSTKQVRAMLRPLTLLQVQEVGRSSGVPWTTIYKIKRGETVNPGMDTVRKFLPHLVKLTEAT